MKHSCEYYMNRYLLLDKGERLPAKLSAHMLHCPSCRRDIKLFSHAEKIASQSVKLPATVNLEQVRKIVSQADPNYKPHVNQMSMGSWIFFGLLLLVSFIGLGTLSIKSRMLGFNFYMSGAIFLVIYSFAFIGCNLDYLVKRLHIRIES